MLDPITIHKLGMARHREIEAEMKRSQTQRVVRTGGPGEPAPRWLILSLSILPLVGLLIAQLG